TILTPFPQGDYDAYNFYNGSPSAPGCYAPSHCGANFVFTGSTHGQTGTLLTGVLGSAQFPTVVGLLVRISHSQVAALASRRGTP
ncbi:MAG: hypothetical protein ACRD01_12310, partial [Terriglobales bacterium]